MAPTKAEMMEWMLRRGPTPSVLVSAPRSNMAPLSNEPTTAEMREWMQRNSKPMTATRGSAADKACTIPEVLTKIIRLLPARDVVVIERVGRSWQNIITTDTLLQRELLLNPSPAASIARGGYYVNVNTARVSRDPRIGQHAIETRFNPIFVRVNELWMDDLPTASERFIQRQMPVELDLNILMYAMAALRTQQHISCNQMLIADPPVHSATIWYSLHGDTAEYFVGHMRQAIPIRLIHVALQLMANNVQLGDAIKTIWLDVDGAWLLTTEERSEIHVS